MTTKEVPKWWAKLKYFKPNETHRAACGMMKNSFPQPEEMDEGMMKKLDKARKIAGIRFTITSSYRPGDELSHGRGLAVDIRVVGSSERKIVAKSLDMANFPRIGIYDKHVHGDTDLNLPSGWWGGKSE